MRLEEAIYLMSAGDKFEPNDKAYSTFEKIENCTLVTTSGSVVALSAQNLVLEGKIIKKKQEPVTAEEIVKREREFATHETKYGYELRLVNAGAKNTHLLYAELMEALEYMFKEGGHVYAQQGREILSKEATRKAFLKIKQHNTEGR
jgi:hypothetical protein